MSQHCSSPEALTAQARPCEKGSTLRGRFNETREGLRDVLSAGRPRQKEHLPGAQAIASLGRDRFVSTRIGAGVIALVALGGCGSRSELLLDGAGGSGGSGSSAS